ncbi:MAG: pyridine nucleotide-disulfide oxidoreductase, partial [Candidatus Bathyarchaeia archaeon]
VNDLVDYAAEQGERAAESAFKLISEGDLTRSGAKPLIRGRNVRLIVPQLVSCLQDVVFYGRVSAPEENVAIRFEEIGKIFRLPAVRPPEMFRVKVPASDLLRLRCEKLTVNVMRLEA